MFCSLISIEKWIFCRRSNSGSLYLHEFLDISSNGLVAEHKNEGDRTLAIVVSVQAVVRQFLNQTERCEGKVCGDVHRVSPVQISHSDDHQESTDHGSFRFVKGDSLLQRVQIACHLVENASLRLLLSDTLSSRAKRNLLKFFVNFLLSLDRVLSQFFVIIVSVDEVPIDAFLDNSHTNGNYKC